MSGGLRADNPAAPRRAQAEDRFRPGDPVDHPQPDDSRPDWLVGADEGVAAEQSRTREPSGAPVRLIRPHEASAAAEEPGAAGREAPVLRPAPASAPASETRPWTAAASSVPRLRLVTSPAAKPAAPRPAREADDSGDEGPEAANAAGPFETFLDDPTSSPAPALRPAAPAAAARRAVPVLREAWWVIALDAVRTDRRLQIGLGVVAALGLVLLVFRPGAASTIPLREIREHPERYDNASVAVSGKVGEVFAVGGGYAFNLHQGRDTLVVFTRSRTPVPREKVTVKGSISTGFLDGRPRQALFEAF